MCRSTGSMRVTYLKIKTAHFSDRRRVCNSIHKPSHYRVQCYRLGRFLIGLLCPYGENGKREGMVYGIRPRLQIKSGTFRHVAATTIKRCLGRSDRVKLLATLRLSHGSSIMTNLRHTSCQGLRVDILGGIVPFK